MSLFAPDDKRVPVTFDHDPTSLELARAMYQGPGRKLLGNKEFYDFWLETWNWLLELEREAKVCRYGGGRGYIRWKKIA